MSDHGLSDKQLKFCREIIENPGRAVWKAAWQAGYDHANPNEVPSSELNARLRSTASKILRKSEKVRAYLRAHGLDPDNITDRGDDPASGEPAPDEVVSAEHRSEVEIMRGRRYSLLHTYYQLYLRQDSLPPWPGAKYRDARKPPTTYLREAEYLADIKLLHALDHGYFRISAAGIQRIENSDLPKEI